jgi:hypothetical protein
MKYSTPKLREAESKFANFPEKLEFLFLERSGNIYLLHITSFIANATTYLHISFYNSAKQDCKLEAENVYHSSGYCYCNIHVFLQTLESSFSLLLPFFNVNNICIL